MPGGDPEVGSDEERDPDGYEDVDDDFCDEYASPDIELSDLVEPQGVR